MAARGYIYPTIRLTSPVSDIEKIAITIHGLQNYTELKTAYFEPSDEANLGPKYQILGEKQY